MCQPYIVSSGLSFMAEDDFWCLLKTIISCDLFNIIIIVIIVFIIIINFSECTEVIATSLIPLDTILHEICGFIIGFSCTVCTKIDLWLAD